jgi:hypothetical protein
MRTQKFNQKGNLTKSLEDCFSMGQLASMPLALKKIFHPSTLTEDAALALLQIELPEKLLENPDEPDFKARDYFEIEGNLDKGFIFRVIAGRGYEKIESWVNATYSFSRAARLAFYMDFYNASIKCDEKNIELHSRLVQLAIAHNDRTRRINYNAEMEIARERIEKCKSRLRERQKSATPISASQQAPLLSPQSHQSFSQFRANHSQKYP